MKLALQIDNPFIEAQQAIVDMLMVRTLIILEKQHLQNVLSLE